MLGSNNRLLALASLLATLQLPTGLTASPGNFDAEVAAILERIQAPVFPDRDFVITDFGASAGADATVAIRDAIRAAHASGGGRVVVPAGETFHTGAIHLLSNVNLHLGDGATLLFSTDPNDYLPAVYTRWEGVELMGYSPLIYAFEAENIAVTGKGTLDGQAAADNWWPWKGQERRGWKPGDPHQADARTKLFEMAEAGVPVEQREFADGSYLRPQFIQPYRSRNILIEGVTLLRSPMWEINPVLCNNVTVRGVTIISHGPNNDGCNPESCVDVLIEDCIFDTGDDCIAIKAGRNADGRRIAQPSENIVIRNCVMRDGHGGVVIGSEMSGGVRNVYVDNCEMSSPRLQRGLRIKTNSYRGGFVENVHMRNVRIGEVADAVFRVNFLYEEGAGGPHLPTVRGITLENVRSGRSKYPLYVVGFEDSLIEDVHLIDCQFEGAKEPSVIRHVKGLRFDNLIQNSGIRSDQWGMPLSQ